jgi:hypothetical protein
MSIRVDIFNKSEIEWAEICKWLLENAHADIQDGHNNSLFREIQHWAERDKTYLITTNNEFWGTMYFEDSKDAMLYKMRWG